MMRGAILVSVLVLFLGGLAQGTPPAKAPAKEHTEFPPPLPFAGGGGGEGDEPNFSGSLRVRFESLSNINDLNDAKDDDNDYVVSRLRLKADMPMGNGRRAQLVLQDARAFGEEFAVPGGERRLDLQEGYLEEKHLLGADGLRLRFGRQELVYGEERLVGTFGYNNVGRTYDAVKLRWDREGAWHEAFVSRVVHDPLAPSQQSLWGSYNSFDLGGARVLEAYVLRKLDPRAAVRQDRFTYGLHSRGPLSGGFDYGLEADFQRGDWGASSIDAWAYHSELGYALGDRRKTRLVLEVNQASGDGNPADSTVRTFDNLYPTNHYLYGIADLFAWQNMGELRLGVATDVGPRLRGSLDFHRFTLQDVRDNWYRANRKLFRAGDPTGLASDDAGDEWDLQLKFQWQKDRVLELGASHFSPGDNLRGRGLPADDADLVYLQTLFNF